MSKIDWRIERERLSALYRAMSDGELQEVANDRDSSTDEARKALRAEMLARGMQAQTVEEHANHEAGAPPVIVGRYGDLAAAIVAKSVLDSAGIEAFLLDDNVVRLDWILFNAPDGIKLLVRGEDAEEAKKLLEEWVSE